MIPKIIHYIWVGGNPKSELILKCIASWKEQCPDYEIIEWNETNFDINSNKWVQEAIKQRNWALAADVMRVCILKEHGGIYMDTDVEILRPLDEFLKHEFFIGYESRHWVNSAIIGSVKGHPILGLCYQRYIGECVISKNTNLLTVHAYSAAVKKLYGIVPDGKTRIINDVALYQWDYFYPRHYLKNKTVITENTYTFHHYLGTWHTKGEKRRYNFVRFAQRVIGRRIYQFFEKRTAHAFLKQLLKEYDTIELENEKKEN